MLTASDVEKLRQESMNNIQILDDCGFEKPVARLTLEDKEQLVRAVALHGVLMKSLGEATQFRDGLSALEVNDSMKKNPAIFRPYFCSAEKDILTSGTHFTSLFVISMKLYMLSQINYVAYLMKLNIQRKVHLIVLRRKQHFFTLWNTLMIVKEVQKLSVDY